MTGVVVAGVSGAGKTTVGAALAARLEMPFCDGDDLHAPSEVERMRAGHPLTEADRAPWLARVGDWLAEHDGVVACSALRRRHRDALRARAPELVVVLLDGDEALLRERQRDRPGHFMPASLMTSQLDTLEPLDDDERGVTLDVAAPVADLVEAAARFCRGSRLS